jgi:hypothetical protein
VLIIEKSPTLPAWYLSLSVEEFPIYFPVFELLGELEIDEHMARLGIHRDIIYYFTRGYDNKYITDIYKKRIVNALDVLDLPYKIYEEK